MDRSLRRARLVLVFLVVCAFASVVCAKNAMASSPTARQRIMNETKEAVVDVLTGEDTAKPPATRTRALPPGLAKQGKVPPGHAVAAVSVPAQQKPEPRKDSLIRRMVRGVFGSND